MTHRHFGIPRQPEQDREINTIAGLLTLAIVFVIVSACKVFLG